MKNAQRCSVNN